MKSRYFADISFSFLFSLTAVYIYEVTFLGKMGEFIRVWQSWFFICRFGHFCVTRGRRGVKNTEKQCDVKCEQPLTEELSTTPVVLLDKILTMDVSDYVNACCLFKIKLSVSRFCNITLWKSYSTFCPSTIQIKLFNI